MTYKILNTRVVDTIIYTEVEYTFDNQTVIVEVAHFNPQSKEEVETSIVNRAQSELQRLQIIESINLLVPEIEVNTIKPI